MSLKFVHVNEDLFLSLLLLYVSSVPSMCYCVDLYFYSSESEICIARCNTIIVMFVALAGYKCQLMLFFSVYWVAG